MTRYLLRLLLTTALAVPTILSGCAFGSGDGEVTGTINVEGCGGDSAAAARTYDMKPSFFALTLVGQQVEIRVQTHSVVPVRTDGAEVDGLIIEISRPDLLKTGQPVEVVPTALGQPWGGHSVKPTARASLTLDGTCPDVPVPFGMGTGSLLFTHFGLEVGDRIKGSFELTFFPPASHTTDGPSAPSRITGWVDFVFRSRRNLSKDTIGPEQPPGKEGATP